MSNPIASKIHTSEWRVAAPAGFCEHPGVRMTRTIPTALLSTALLLAASTAGSDEEWTTEEPTEATARQIRRAVGDPDPGALRRLAVAIAPAELVAAIYSGSRSQRLAALEAAAFLADPWPVLPYLAVVMGAAERQAASRATGSLMAALVRVQSSGRGTADLVPGQAAQLVEQLFGIAADDRLDLDIRTSALDAVLIVSTIDGAAHLSSAEFFEDPEAAVRGAAMAMLEPPLGDDQLARVAVMAAGDDDRMLRGQAAALLCENALAHGVTAPSPDLRKLLTAVLGDLASPPGAIAAVLGCLARFAPASRADLVEAALRHPAPEVESYWKELVEESL